MDEYPLQGILNVGPDGPEINLGTRVGVREGMKFAVLAERDPNAVLPDLFVVARGGVREERASVRLEGFDSDSVPPEGWFVQVEPDQNDVGN